MTVYSIQFTRPLRSARLATTGEAALRTSAAPMATPNPAGTSLPEPPTEIQQQWQIVKQSLRKLQSQLAEQNSRQLEMLQNLQEDVVELAIVVAARVIGESDVSEQRIRHVLDQVMEQIQTAHGPITNDITVWLHPEDVEVTKNLELPPGLFIKPDSQMERGESRLDGALYTYAHHWKQQVVAIRTELLAELQAG